MKAAIIHMARAVAFLDGKSPDLEVTVDFDDSIIEDTNTTIDRNTKLVQAGLRSKLSAIMEINKCSEEEARKEMEKIAEESQITGNDIDWTNMEQENPEAGFSPDEQGGDTE